MPTKLPDTGMAYQASLAIAERLAKADPADAAWQRELVLSLIRISFAADPAGARMALERALAIAEALARDGKLAAAQQKLPQLIRGALEKLPK